MLDIYRLSTRSAKCETFLTSGRVSVVIEDSCSILCMHESISNVSIKVLWFYHVVKKAL